MCKLFYGFLWCFISCLSSHSDGTHSLQRIHWWASNTTFLQICSDEETNSSTSWMASGWVIFVNYSFKSLHFSTSSTQKNILFIDMNIKCLFIQMFICNRCRLLSVHSSFNSTERRIKWIMRSLHTHGDTFYEVHIPVYLDTLSNAFQHHLYEHSLQASTLTKLWGIDQTFH